MAKYLASAGGMLCCNNTSNTDHADGMLKMAVNDPSEISFGAIVGQIQSYGKIGLTNAGGFIQVKVKGDF